MQEDKNAIFQMRFPQKLWYLLNMHTDAILWGGTGRTILLNYRILHNYLQCDHSIFKTTNISSFVRQLNLYGFRKVTSHLQDPLCNSSNPYMHEYVHDYFQFGRPEMLNKITRKALAVRRNFKPKSIYGNSDEMVYLTPLQKARRALREALKKAAQDLFMHSCPKQYLNLKFESEDGQENFCDDEDNIEIDWFLNKTSTSKDSQVQPPQTDLEDSQTNSNPRNQQDSGVNNENYENTSQESLMNFADESVQQNNDNFPVQFLSMPELDPEPVEEKTGIELLAEFDIENDANQGIAQRYEEKATKPNSLNCVLPSINNDPNYECIADKDNNGLDHYHGEWDQMFNDIMSCKSSSQECGSDLKELYSQISRTIDLLNS